jgi:hypothetical protein
MSRQGFIDLCVHLREEVGQPNAQRITDRVKGCDRDRTEASLDLRDEARRESAPIGKPLQRPTAFLPQGTNVLSNCIHTFSIANMHGMIKTQVEFPAFSTMHRH